MLSNPLVYFIGFSNDLMRGAYIPFDLPIVNTKTSIPVHSDWLGSHVEGRELGEANFRKEFF